MPEGFQRLSPLTLVGIVDPGCRSRRCAFDVFDQRVDRFHVEGRRGDRWIGDPGPPPASSRSLRRATAARRRGAVELFGRGRTVPDDAPVSRMRLPR